jgi:hypothetical protein
LFSGSVEGWKKEFFKAAGVLLDFAFLIINQEIVAVVIGIAAEYMFDVEYLKGYA